MKKSMSWGVYSLAAAMLLTSCVAKRKYVDAQNTIAELRADSTALHYRYDSVQQSYTSLSERNARLQQSMDSTNTWVSGQQNTWNAYQTSFTDGRRTVDEVHSSLHQELDEMLGSENIMTAGGRVHVTLPEKTLFSAGSSRLSANGAQILQKLAATVKANPNVEIDITTDKEFYVASNVGSSQSGLTTSDPANQNANDPMATDQTKVKVDDDIKIKDGDTKVKMDKDGEVKIKSSTGKTKLKSNSSSYNGNGTYATTTKAKTSGTTKRKSESNYKSKTYKSNTAGKSTATSTWSLNMARSASIAKKLVDEGVEKSRILVTKDKQGTTTPAKKDFQIIISPKSDSFYQMLEGKSGTTSMK